LKNQQQRKVVERLTWSPALSALAANATGKHHILGHDGASSGVNGTQVGVLKETNQVSLGGLMESGNSHRLEAQICLEILSNLTDKSLQDFRFRLNNVVRIEILKKMRASSPVATNRTWKGILRINKSVDFWYLRISRRATVPLLQTNLFVCQYTLSDERNAPSPKWRDSTSLLDTSPDVILIRTTSEKMLPSQGRIAGPGGCVIGARRIVLQHKHSTNREKSNKKNQQNIE
jgi:hypothetical protein